MDKVFGGESRCEGCEGGIREGEGPWRRIIHFGGIHSCIRGERRFWEHCDRVS
jgi:hypothetical protein